MAVLPLGNRCHCLSLHGGMLFFILLLEDMLFVFAQEAF
jgi:hypothetical protein